MDEKGAEIEKVKQKILDACIGERLTVISSAMVEAEAEIREVAVWDPQYISAS